MAAWPAGVSPDEFQKLYERYIKDGTIGRPPATYKHKVRPYDTRIKLALDRACEQLPLRLAHKISEIRFGPDGVTNPRFEVVYMGGKVIEFDDVDNFPSDADIARIALECP